MSVESDGSLKLAVVELEDVGTWTCEAKSSVGQISVQAEVQAIYSKLIDSKCSSVGQISVQAEVQAIYSKLIDSKCSSVGQISVQAEVQAIYSKLANSKCSG